MGGYLGHCCLGRQRPGGAPAPGPAPLPAKKPPPPLPAGHALAPVAGVFVYPLPGVAGAGLPVPQYPPPAHPEIILTNPQEAVPPKKAAPGFPNPQGWH